MFCPIAYWKQHRPDALAVDALSYQEFDALIQSLCTQFQAYSEQILAWVPYPRPVDIALFFAAWRTKKAVYPLSFRLPMEAIQERLERTGARLIEPNPSSKKEEIYELDTQALATLIETSSSKKIACHTLESHLINARAAIDALSLQREDVYQLNLPLFHISGIATCIRTFLAGAHLVTPEHPIQPTHISMVPTQLYRSLRDKDPLDHLKCILVGGAPFPPSFHRKGLPLYITYGLTEAASMVAIKPPNKTTYVLPHIEYKFSDTKEILLKGPSLLKCYFGSDPSAEWFPTKDLGVDHEGEFTIIGRKDRQFISGGENIQPEEIEQALLSYPGIIEAKVSPQSDQQFGQVPIAQVYAEKPIHLKELQQRLELHLPRFKIPKRIELSSVPLKNSKLAQMAENPIRQKN